MNGKPEKSDRDWIDPDDGVELTEEQLDRAEYAVGDRIVRPARGTLTRDYAAAGAREEISLNVDQDLAEALRATGPDWQSEAAGALREWLNRRGS
ncbi:BrnA antitoxin family protein [Jiella avicenniae]|uniref:BrnA antitoxin family protein n=1 Tax=Jiella avicenniae TaxID=2907202 RepID=A0A9X1T5D5_9HYPH|nr:BrnA antitoxin family protein [Jiella avicenniae]MCE7029052.1 BrnA antitoxin family protein [Jiella avicenniae]